jgi:hypothetical protein
MSMTDATNSALITPDWWSNGVRAPYARGESFYSLVHGNTDDFVWLGWSVDRWIAQQFGGTVERPGQEVVITYSPARGLTFQSPQQRKLFDKTFSWPPALPPELARDPQLAAANQMPEEMPLPSEPDQLLALALEFLRLARKQDPDDANSVPFVNRRKNAAGETLSGIDQCQCGSPQRDHTVSWHDGARSGALIVNHLDLEAAKAPQKDASLKRVLEMLHDAGTDPALIQSWNLITLIARDLTAVDEYVRTAPSMKIVKVPLPDYDGRLDTIRRLQHREGEMLRMEISPEELAAITAGLGRRDLEDIVLEAADGVLTPEIARARQAELMDKRYGGVLIRLDTSLDFDDLGGMAEAKDCIDTRMVTPILNGHAQDAIRGLALIGPPGTGKSALAQAAGKRARINAIEIRAGAIKSKWHGESEHLVEQLITGAEAFAPTFCYMDEFDKLFGSSASAQHENAPDQAMRGRIQTWMASTKNIYFVVATNYPERVDPALFRTGRIDVKAPILAPETPVERADILMRLLRRYQVTDLPSMPSLVALCTANTGGWVGSDLELAVKDAIGTMHRDPTISLLVALEDSVQNIIPADNPEIDAQTANAIKFCNDLRLLPPRARERRMQELRARSAARAIPSVDDVIEAAAMPATPTVRRRREIA